MRKFLFAMAAMVGGLVATPAAQAGFLFVDIFDGTDLLTVVDNAAGLDLDPSLNSIIVNVNNAAFLAKFSAELRSGSSISAASNQTTAAGDGLSSLTTSFTLNGKAGVTSNFTVTAGQTGFVVPGDPRQVDTSGSFTFTNGGSGALGGNGSFQGSVGSTNGASDLFDSLIAINSTGNPPNSGAGNGAGFIFSNGNNPYSMQNVLTAHIVKTKNAVVQGQGTTIVRVPDVPEPSTIALLATFAGSLAVGAFWRRSRVAVSE